MMDIEIFESINGRKRKYLVTKINADYDEVMKFSKKFFKCSEAHIEFTSAYIYDGLLYLENPHKKGTKTVGVAYYV